MRYIAHLHPFHRQKCCQIRSERSQHEDDENPIGGDQDAAADRFWRFPSSLRRERSQREPKTLDEREMPIIICAHSAQNEHLCRLHEKLINLMIR